MTTVATQSASVAGIALESALRFGPRPALTTPHGRPITYAELGTAVREIAGELIRLSCDWAKNRFTPWA